MSFISLTNAEILPETDTAAAFAASLPDGSNIPYSRSRRETRSPSRKPIVVPSTIIAMVSTVNSRSRSPDSIVNIAVIILVVDAMARCSSAFFSYSTVPVSASITIALTADVLTANTFTVKIGSIIAKVTIKAIIFFISSPR